MKRFSPTIGWLALLLGTAAAASVVGYHRASADVAPATTRPAGEPVWQYATISLGSLLDGLDPPPQLNAQLMARWETGGVVDQQQRLAKELRDKQQAKSNQFFLNRVSGEINRMSSLGFDPCPPPAGMEVLGDSRDALLWFRRAR